ncbi:MAG: hypothetical protein EBZ48_06585, partial [Proteobacteria bacterium]|nr:hypothetical protein [Pseudomonadota bacterium]
TRPTIVTRLWLGLHTSTAVQYREDSDTRVWLHTNIGWVPTQLTLPSEAEELAKGYSLEETSEEVALSYL